MSTDPDFESSDGPEGEAEEQRAQGEDGTPQGRSEAHEVPVHGQAAPQARTHRGGHRAPARRTTSSTPSSSR